MMLCFERLNYSLSFFIYKKSFRKNKMNTISYEAIKKNQTLSAWCDKEEVEEEPEIMD